MILRNIAIMISNCHCHFKYNYRQKIICCFIHGKSESRATQKKNSGSDDALDDDGDDLDDGKVGDGNDGGMMTCFPYILSI